MNDIKELIDQYQKEFEEDVKLDRINLEEKQLTLAGIKAKWIKRLIDNKQEIEELNELYEEAINTVINNIINNAEIILKTTKSKRICWNEKPISFAFNIKNASLELPKVKTNTIAK